LGVLSPPQSYPAIYLSGKFESLSNSGFVINFCLDSERILPLVLNTIQKAAQSGFSSKSSTEFFAQRITVHNNKFMAIRNLDVIDVVPVSQDKRIDVKLLNILL
jgi:hypothetical protein